MGETNKKKHSFVQGKAQQVKETKNKNWNSTHSNLNGVRSSHLGLFVIVEEILNGENDPISNFLNHSIRKIVFHSKRNTTLPNDSWSTCDEQKVTCQSNLNMAKHSFNTTALAINQSINQVIKQATDH
jgi:hypothetical protein